MTRRKYRHTLSLQTILTSKYHAHIPNQQADRNPYRHAEHPSRLSHLSSMLYRHYPRKFPMLSQHCTLMSGEGSQNNAQGEVRGARSRGGLGMTSWSLTLRLHFEELETIHFVSLP